MASVRSTVGFVHRGFGRWMGVPGSSAARASIRGGDDCERGIIAGETIVATASLDSKEAPLLTVD